MNISTIGCDFEDGTHCGWIQDPDHDIDWTLHHRSTPTEGTGPLYDHTFGKEGNGKSKRHPHDQVSYFHYLFTSELLCVPRGQTHFNYISCLCKGSFALRKTREELKSEL